MSSKPKTNLSDLFILDFTGMISGAFCTKLLADLGANVLKIEPPGGEIMRNVAPLMDNKKLRLWLIEYWQEKYNFRSKKRNPLIFALS